MSRSLTLTFAALLLATNLTVSGSGEQAQNQVRHITPEEHEAMMLKAMSSNIQSVARVLKDEKVDIEAQLLFTAKGRKQLEPQLVEKFPAMQSVKLYSEPLHGVVMADKLTFTERLEIAADAVVIARHIIFNGKAPVIKGPHDFHLFALSSVSAANGTDTVVTIDTSGEGVNYVPVPAQSSIRSANGSVTIDTSGADGDDGSTAAAAEYTDAIPGASGKAGESGANGTAGKPGSCAEDKNGGMGNPGSDGLPGENGTNGGKGKDGTDAHDQTIMIPNLDSPYFNLIAKGGPGGKGGRGGDAGDGGTGGDGGPGGAGIGCQCNPGGVGEGGRGGAAGSGGAGGVGGKGGDGGRGGKAAHFVIFRPPRDYDLSHVRNFGGAGRGGRAGDSGRGGVSGRAGTPGSGGAGGHVESCNGRNGSPGAGGNWGPQGRWGLPAKPGDWGEAGSLTLTQVDK